MNSESPRGPLLWLTLGAVILVSGCQKTHYELDLKPDGKTLNRKLTAWREKGADEVDSLSQAELKQLAEAYGTKPPAPAPQKFTFEGSFTGEQPRDVGGRGWYLHWNSPLGSVAVYSERFRGDDDLAPDLDARRRAVGALADLLVGWADAELEDAEGFDKLRHFLDVELRHDLTNLCLYWWSYTRVGPAENQDAMEVLARMGQYLAERDYFPPQQAPRLFRVAQEASDGRPEKLLQILQRLMAAKMGVPADKPVPESLKMLAEPELLLASLDRYAKTTPRYAAMVERWRKDAESEPGRDPPQPRDVLKQMLAEAFPLGTVLFGGDELRVRLALPAEPLATNGDWDAKESAVSWSRRIARDDQPPTSAEVLFAVWSRPRIMVQQSYFGRVALDRQRLADYCLWYAGLTEEESRQWDAFLPTLAGREDLSERLRRFRFTGEPRFDAAPGFDSHAARAVELIQQGLEADP